MIKISNLSKKFGDIQALNSLNLHIKKGSIFGLLGVNGAGKTTLLSILNGLMLADEGEITINSLDLKRSLVSIREKSSLIPQTLAFYENLSVKENLDFFVSIFKLSGTEREANLKHAIEVNNLENILSQKASTLSGGQKRRLNIAIGLLNSPDIIYLDEPTVGIDPQSRSDILDSILELKKQGKTIIYTSHYMNEIEKICDDVAILHHGNIIKHAPLDELISLDNNAVVIDILNHKSIKFNDKSRLSQELERLEKENFNVQSVHFAQTDLERLFMEITQ